VGAVTATLALTAGAIVGFGAWMVVGAVSHRDVGPQRFVRGDRLRRLLVPMTIGVVVWAMTGWPVAAATAVLAAAAGGRLFGGGRQRDAAIARTEAIASWTEMIRDAIGAAAGLEEAVMATATIAPEPLRPAVGMLVARLQRENLATALVAFGEQVHHPSADLVVAALTIAARMEASDLTGLLTRLADAIRGDARMRIRVEVGRARIRTATRVIVGVVGATIVLLTGFNRGYLQAYDSFGGQLVLVVVAGIFAGGAVLIDRMATLSVPERFRARTGAPA
jgi:hypothetical protein